MITMLKVARQNKMLDISDDSDYIVLEKSCQQSLKQIEPNLPEFRIH